MAARAPFRIPGARISHIFIAVNDLPAMSVFYRQTLGFDVLYEDAGKSVFLALPGEPYPQIALTASPKPRTGSDPHWFIVIETDDIASVRDRMHRDGLSIGGIEPVPFGRAAMLRDPEGNVIEIHQAERGGGSAE
ncbi:MAG: VOC family protein [Proteobacteria bacterium]|nr:VOC family protein [Pseudomonadota bacterium]